MHAAPSGSLEEAFGCPLIFEGVMFRPDVRANGTAFVPSQGRESLVYVDRAQREDRA